MLLRAAVRCHQEHPEISIRRDALLWSINERLGALLPPGAAAGLDLTPLGNQFVAELLEVALIEQRERATALEALEAETDG